MSNNPKVNNTLFYKAIVTLLFGLFVMWTGLYRCVEASAFKPNAFYFCMVTGAIGLAAAYLYQLGMCRAGLVVALIALLPVLMFYLYCFVVQPEKDATVRVALVILVSIAELALITMPSMPRDLRRRE